MSRRWVVLDQNAVFKVTAVEKKSPPKYLLKAETVDPETKRHVEGCQAHDAANEESGEILKLVLIPEEGDKKLLVNEYITFTHKEARQMLLEECKKKDLALGWDDCDDTVVYGVVRHSGYSTYQLKAEKPLGGHVPSVAPGTSGRKLKDEVDNRMSTIENLYKKGKNEEAIRLCGELSEFLHKEMEKLDVQERSGSNVDMSNMLHRFFRFLYEGPQLHELAGCEKKKGKVGAIEHYSLKKGLFTKVRRFYEFVSKTWSHAQYKKYKDNYQVDCYEDKAYRPYREESTQGECAGIDGTCHGKPNTVQRLVDGLCKACINKKQDDAWDSLASGMRVHSTELGKKQCGHTQRGRRSTCRR
eukprot:Sspe_Gene.103319::Locus_79135_Transcript_2_2_Confidence_0.667_Length_1389::g.103319::m.103319